MKRIVFCFLLLWSVAYGQNPTNYLYRGTRERLISGMFDSTLRIPRYNGTPSGLRVSENSQIDGAIAMDTTNHRMYIFSGNAWVRLAKLSETFYEADGTLSGDRSVDANGNDLTISNIFAGSFTTSSDPSATIGIGQSTSGKSGLIIGTNINLYPNLGGLYVDSLNSGSSSDSVLTWNASTGQVKKINASLINAAATRISALLDANAFGFLTNGAYTQEWNWDGITNSNALILQSASTGASGNAQTVLNVALSGANSNSTQTTYGAKFSNTHTGTSSTNIAGSFTASGGTNNYAIVSTGRVGVNSTAPDSTLTVSGSLRVSSNVLLQGTTTPYGRLQVPMGELSYFNTTGTLITISGTSNGSTNMVKDSTPTTLSAMPYEFDMPVNGRLRYTGAVTKMFHVAVTSSFTPATPADIFVLGVAKNKSVLTESKVLGSSSGTQFSALHIMVELSTNDYLELYIGNTSGSRNVTCKSLNMFAMGL